MNAITKPPRPAVTDIAQHKDCKNKKNTRNGGVVDLLFRGMLVTDPLDRAGLVLDALVEIFEAAGDDKALTQSLQQMTIEQIAKVGIIGSPSGLSPPQTPSQDVSLTDTHSRAASRHTQPPPSFPLPDEWWIDHKSSGISPYQFTVDTYSQYFKQGWTRAVLTRDGQDKQLYDALVYWLRKPANRESIPDTYKDAFQTRQDRNQKDTMKVNGQISVETVPDPVLRHRLHNAAHKRRSAELAVR